jgi:hypothetical protein
MIAALAIAVLASPKLLALGWWSPFVVGAAGFLVTFFVK